MELLHAVLAAVISTVFMNLSSYTEMHWRERQASVVPGMATNKILSVFGVPTLEGRSLKILSEWTHYLYGAGWGIVFWLLVSVWDLPLVLSGVLFFLVVWIVEQIQLPLLNIGVPPSWKWGLRENLIDAWHHIVYAAGTTLGYWLIGLTG